MLKEKDEEDNVHRRKLLMLEEGVESGNRAWHSLHSARL